MSDLVKQLDEIKINSRKIELLARSYHFGEIPIPKDNFIWNYNDVQDLIKKGYMESKKAGQYINTVRGDEFFECILNYAGPGL